MFIPTDRTIFTNEKIDAWNDDDKNNPFDTIDEDIIKYLKNHFGDKYKKLFEKQGELLLEGGGGDIENCGCYYSREDIIVCVFHRIADILDYDVNKEYKKREQQRHLSKCVPDKPRVNVKDTRTPIYIENPDSSETSFYKKQILKEYEHKYEQVTITYCKHRCGKRMDVETIGVHKEVYDEYMKLRNS